VAKSKRSSTTLEAPKPPDEFPVTFEGKNAELFFKYNIGDKLTFYVSGRLNGLNDRKDFDGKRRKSADVRITKVTESAPDDHGIEKQISKVHRGE